MAAKVVWYRDAWWVRVHAHGRKRDRRVGTSAADRRLAEEAARKINAKLILGEYSASRQERLGCAEQLRIWHRTWAPTMKPTYEQLTRGLIDKHLAPYFEDRDLREIREADLLRFIRVKLEAGLSPKTITNALSIVRRVYHLLQREELVAQNPAARIGELMRRVGRATATETAEVQHWTREEIAGLLKVAWATEPAFAPLLHLLLSTGMRRGEALGLHWAEIDFEGGAISIRRSVTSLGVTTPKSGRGRRVAMPPGLAS